MPFLRTKKLRDQLDRTVWSRGNVDQTFIAAVLVPKNGECFSGQVSHTKNQTKRPEGARSELSHLSKFQTKGRNPFHSPLPLMII